MDDSMDEMVPGSPADEQVDGEKAEPKSDAQRAWYVLHTYSGYEKKVKRNLERQIEERGLQDMIFQVIVPVEMEVDIKDGQRRQVERKIFPGYVLVQMIMDDETWYIVRNTPGVTGFVGSGLRPTPLPEAEVDKIMKRMTAEAPKVRVSFHPGQKVRIIDGPFTDFNGVVEEVDAERGKIRLTVSFFNRDTPVELDFLQVERI
ncbi:MAG: transcription termination/antitermination protein NusG [Anaerolineae bacterium]